VNCLAVNAPPEVLLVTVVTVITVVPIFRVMAADALKPAPLMVTLVPGTPLVAPNVIVGDAAPVNVAVRELVTAQITVAAYDPPVIIGPVIVYVPVNVPVALEVPENTPIALPKFTEYAVLTGILPAIVTVIPVGPEVGVTVT